jgi:hypothetical protein
MRFPVSLPGFEDGRLEVESGLWSGPRLLLDGQEAPRGARRGEYLLRNSLGYEEVASLKQGSFLDAAPSVVFGGETYRLAPPLRWYQWAWGGLPLLLMIVGGALGGMFGAMAAAINFHIFRSSRSPALQFVGAGLVSLGAVLLYLVTAIPLTLWLGSMLNPPKPFISEAGRFQVVSPYSFTEIRQPVTNVPGYQLEMPIYVAEQGEQAYFVGYLDYPVEVPGDFDRTTVFENMKTGFLSNINATADGERVIEVAGNPGIEVIATGTVEEIPIKAIVRAVTTDTRIYIVTAMATNEVELTQAMTDFVESFQILD